MLLHTTHTHTHPFIIAPSYFTLSIFKRLPRLLYHKILEGNNCVLFIVLCLAPKLSACNIAGIQQMFVEWMSKWINPLRNWVIEERQSMRKRMFDDQLGRCCLNLILGLSAWQATISTTKYSSCPSRIKKGQWFSVVITPHAMGLL